MRKIFVTCMASLSLLSFSYSQEAGSSRKENREKKWNEEQVFRVKSFGVSLQNQQNTVVSSLIYSGIGLTLASERQRLMPNRLTISNRRIQYNMLSSENNSGSTHSAATQFGYDYLKPVKENFYVGGNIQLNGNYRLAAHLGNSGIQYEIFPTIGLSSAYKTDFQLFGKNFGLDATVKLPVLGAVIATPKFSRSFDEANTEILFLGKMVNPQTSVFVNLPANKRFPNRQHRIGYEWNMNSFGRGNDRRMTMATHTLHFVATIDKVK